MLRHGLSITMLVLSAGLAQTALQQGHGWLDRVVQFQKNKLFKEVKELAPINLKVELRQKPESYEDSRHWDYESVLRLLRLIRQSEKAKPVLKALRRMLQPTRRIMMSMKQSMQRFPSLKGDSNNFYYDADYTSGEGGAVPPHVAVPEDQAVIIVSNPVEARLPSAQISVKLLREILEARARAARQMPTTTASVPWLDFVKNHTTMKDNATSEEAPDETGSQTTEADQDEGSTTAAGNDTETGDSTTAAGSEAAGDTDTGDSTTAAGSEATGDSETGDSTTAAGSEASGDTDTGESTTAAGSEAADTETTTEPPT